MSDDEYRNQKAVVHQRRRTHNSSFFRRDREEVTNVM